MRDPEHYFNRELSWLAFNARVLAQAGEQTSPVLDRLKFLSIWSSNLDEFFQVRVAGLKDQIDRRRTTRTPDGAKPSDTMRKIRREVDRQTEAAADEYRRIFEELAHHGVELVAWSDLSKRERKSLSADFEDRIFPILTPLAVDPGHPFPSISNLSLSLGVILRDPQDGNRRFARLKVPDTVSQYLRVADGDDRFIAIEEVLIAHMDRLFPGMEITETVAFRLTRNADLEIDEDDALDLLSAVEVELLRRRFQRAVRLELGGALTRDTAELLVAELELDEADVYTSEIPLGVERLIELVSIDRPELREAPHVPVTPSTFRSEDGEAADLFAVLRKRDLLVHHPYESFATTVGELVAQASVDPAVQAIKMTLYRTSGDSPMVQHLIRAAEAGKQVAVVVELKARFDEAANIEWARRLEDSGVHVAYGLVGLKVHTKTLLIVRQDSDGVRRYCHVGTGNYNPSTARIYTDMGLLTSDARIGHDLAHLFNSLTGYGRDLRYELLVVAPAGLRPRIVEFIENEARHGAQGHITMKMNGLVDPDIIDSLYQASQAGVRVDLSIRGICCLRPGVKGLSENIRVRSVIGGFLEHTRLVRFANGRETGDAAILFGSADLMPRNLDRRVEALVPIEAPDLRDRLDHVIELEFADQWLAWELDRKGRWTSSRSDPATNSQQLLAELARGAQ